MGNLDFRSHLIKESGSCSPQEGGFPGGSVGKESTCNVGDTGLVPGLERSLEEGMAAHFSILAWGIPWTEEAGGLQSMGS